MGFNRLLLLLAGNIRCRSALAHPDPNSHANPVANTNSYSLGDANAHARADTLRH
jgi:hypothetical protein